MHTSISSTAWTGVLFASNGVNAVGNLQLAQSSGNWVAYVTNGPGNLTGTLLGSLPAAVNTPTDLLITSVAGVFSFKVNGVNAGTPVTPASAFGGFPGLHLGVAPGGFGFSPIQGLVSDLSISETPEPASAALLGLGTLLLAARRRRGA